MRLVVAGAEIFPIISAVGWDGLKNNKGSAVELENLGIDVKVSAIEVVGHGKIVLSIDGEKLPIHCPYSWNGLKHYKGRAVESPNLRIKTVGVVVVKVVCHREVALTVDTEILPITRTACWQTLESLKDRTIKYKNLRENVESTRERTCVVATIIGNCQIILASHAEKPPVVGAAGGNVLQHGIRGRTPRCCCWD